jgi:hypothetical protein
VIGSSSSSPSSSSLVASSHLLDQQCTFLPPLSPSSCCVVTHFLSFSPQHTITTHIHAPTHSPTTPLLHLFYFFIIIIPSSFHLINTHTYSAHLRKNHPPSPIHPPTHPPIYTHTHTHTHTQTTDTSPS